MEVIDLSGYTVEEKVSIATSHLLPKQRRLHALEPELPTDPDEPSLSSAAGTPDAAVVGCSTSEPVPEQDSLPRLEFTQEISCAKALVVSSLGFVRQASALIALNPRVFVFANKWLYDYMSTRPCDHIDT